VSWLRRKDKDGPQGREDGPDPVAAFDADEPDADEQDDAGRTPAASRSDRSEGPWDVSEKDVTDGYVDLGGLRLSGRDGMELRLEVEEDSGRVIAATIQLGDSAVQLQAFAAPRSEGIWDEIRREIVASITRQGGTADEVPGPFGQELLARVPARTPDGATTHQPARFAGIDGPRWFLRAVFHGAAVYQEDAAAELEQLVRETIVVRGTDAMAPRELLVLQLPGGAEAVAEEDEEEPDDALRPPQRGPEITEVH
jgi:hypothetical protein